MTTRDKLSNDLTDVTLYFDEKFEKQKVITTMMQISLFMIGLSLIGFGFKSIDYVMAGATCYIFVILIAVINKNTLSDERAVIELIKGILRAPDFSRCMQVIENNESARNDLKNRTQTKENIKEFLWFVYNTNSPEVKARLKESCLKTYPKASDLIGLDSPLMQSVKANIS